MSSIGEKGEIWALCDVVTGPRENAADPLTEFYASCAADFAEKTREAMHDRDNFDREAAYWREQAEAMRESCGYAHLAPCWEAP